MLPSTDERGEADLEYRRELNTIELPHEGSHHMIDAKKMRHKTYNKQFKNWACMAQKFRYGHSLHWNCMCVISVRGMLGMLY